MVIEFLTQLHTVLKAYFGEVTENMLQEHHVTLYQVGVGGVLYTPFLVVYLVINHGFLSQTCSTS